MTNPHRGSNFDDWLTEEGLQDDPGSPRSQAGAESGAPETDTNAADTDEAAGRRRNKNGADA